MKLLCKSPKPYTRRYVLLLAVLFGAALAVHGQDGAVSPASEPQTMSEESGAQPSGEQDYLISPDDVLEIAILDVPEMSRQYRVSPLGQVKMPLLEKPLAAAGLTLEQFSDVVAVELQTAGLVSHPQVTTSVKESRAHSVAITGAVKKPQIYSVLGRTTLLDVLSQAEGLTDDASNTAITRGSRFIWTTFVLMRLHQPPSPTHCWQEKAKLCRTPDRPRLSSGF